MKRRSFKVETDARLEDALAQGLGVAKEAARALVVRGAVYVQGRRAQDPGATVPAGRTVMAVEEEGGKAALAEGEALPPLRILYEDDQVLAVDKPPGLTAQPTPGRAGESLLDLASSHLGRTAGLVHRLDRQTSGVTLFGKTREATRDLARQLREGKMEKRYVAVVAGKLPERGEVDLRLSRDPSRIGRWRASRTANGLTAFTRFERLREGEGYCVVALYPRTGRTHQLRAHLRALDAPIAGDALYGGPPRVDGKPAPRCLLHAQALTFQLPGTEKRMTVEAPLPTDLAAFT